MAGLIFSLQKDAKPGKEKREADAMKKRMKQKTLIIIIVLLSAAAIALLAAGFARAERTEPENPMQETAFAGLNISNVRLDYNRSADEVNNAFGEDAESAEDSEDTPNEERPEQDPEQEQPEQQPEQPPEQLPEQPDEQPEQNETSADQPSPAPTPGPSLVISFDSNDDGTVSDLPGEAEGNENPGEDADPDSEEDVEEPDEEEDVPPDVRIATDLGNRTYTTSQLTNDVLDFSASIENGTEDMYLSVYYTSPDGKQKIVSGSGDNYAQALRLGMNQFTLVLKQGGQILAQATYNVRYQAEKATEDNPVVGQNPPSLSTNLDDNTESINNENFMLQVTATDYHGTPIAANNVAVWVDGGLVTNQPTGGSPLEYKLYLEPPLEGDRKTYHITVRASDDEGNSIVKSYDLDYEFIDEGGVIGQATIVIDATAVGLGILEAPFTGDILQGQPASVLLKQCLEEYGYDMVFSGSVEKDFYLRSISRYNFAKYAAPDETLMECIRTDGLAETGQRDKSSLGEYDYTQGSGWMYCVNGYYPGVSLSNYYLNDGDTLYLRFTLAYGKDIGGFASTGGGQGMLSHYCGTWVGGSYYPSHSFEDGKCTICQAPDPNHVHDYVFEILREPTCSESGLQHGICVCGEETDEPIETLAHSFADGKCTECGAVDPNHVHTFIEILNEEPTCTEAGIIREECACGEMQEEILPAVGHQFNERFRCTVCGELDPDHEHSFRPEELGEQDYEIVLAPTCTTPGRKIPVCPHCGERGDKEIYSEYWVEIPVREHTYVEGICTMCGQPDPNYIQPNPEQPGGGDEGGTPEEGGDGE